METIACVLRASDFPSVSVKGFAEERNDVVAIAQHIKAFTKIGKNNVECMEKRNDLKISKRINKSFILTSISKTCAVKFRR